VGITRARRHLVLSWALNRVGPKGTPARARPSRFIAELRPGAVARPRAALPSGPLAVFEVGQRVHHGRRGPGVVGGPSGDHVRVNFDDGAIGVVSARDLRVALESGADEALLKRLTAWRRERARTDGVPAYVVADNKTLAAIAAQRPADQAELLGVPGIGHRKVATYGEEILELIAQR
jgi:DNA helicase-2/ATP-dependent DNA helicase PcrA